jgi:hypothetical protein
LRATDHQLRQTPASLTQVQVLQETSPNRKRKHLHLDLEGSCGLSF